MQRLTMPQLLRLLSLSSAVRQGFRGMAWLSRTLSYQTLIILAIYISSLLTFTSCSSYIKELEAYGFLYFRIFYYACCYFIYYGFCDSGMRTSVTAALTLNIIIILSNTTSSDFEK
jgi:hypothetical protein